MDIPELKRWLLQSFRLRDYTLRPEALNCLVEEFKPLGSQEKQAWLEKITDQLQKMKTTTFAIDQEQIVKCLQECTRRSDDAENVWNVINIFEVPRFVYCSEKNRFIKDESKTCDGLFPDASKKIMMYRRRYNLLYEKTLRHDLFRQQRSLGDNTPVFSLKTVEWFLCCSGKIEGAVIVGLLLQKDNRTYAIEDLTGCIELNMSQAKFHDGLFPEHCFVLVEGVYKDKVFHVQGIGFPPAEPSHKSRTFFANTNTFGGPSDKDLSQCPMLKTVQERNPNAMIVFLSDVWLDKIEVLEKIDVLFSGFRDHPPVAFVLFGNFLFRHKGPQNAENLQTGLKLLGEIISKYKEIVEKSQIVLVPGPTDPGSPNILPRAPIPEILAKGLRHLVPNVVLATNPCRIQYCNREIVAIREDLIKKMCRNTIYFPKTGAIETHFAKTIISQGTLVPLSQNVCPVYWNYSHCLDLYPLPDLIVTADQFNAFTVDHMGCTVVNPGSFMKSGYAFRVYLPATKQVEESMIPEESEAQA